MSIRKQTERRHVYYHVLFCSRQIPLWRIKPELRNQKRTQWCVLGSIRLGRVVFGVAPKISSGKLFPSGNSRKRVGREFGRDARTCTRDARAPHSRFGVRVKFWLGHRR